MKRLFYILIVIVFLIGSTLTIAGCGEDFDTAYIHKCSICGEEFKVANGQFNSTLANSLKPYFEHIENHIMQMEGKNE